jgi:undecaprenyl-diphosphatase
VEQLFQAAVIGIVQGLTEFLPISSSAHLIVLPRLLGWTDPFLNSPAFDVMLHLGTLVALLVYFGRDLWRLFAAFLASLRDRRIGGDSERRLAWLLVVTVVPAALLGVALERFFDTFFRERLLLVALLLAVGAGLLFLAERIGRRDREMAGLRARDAVIIGIAQALALFPGISRSGITIAAGLALGLQREAAARFAFLMGAPIIAGAGLWKVRGVLAEGGLGANTSALAVGIMASTFAGLVAIGALLAFLRRYSTGVFIGYRLLAAALLAAWLLMRAG